MNISNELRRTKVKLDLLQQEGMDWFLMDIAQSLDVDGIFMAKEELKLSYLQFIKDNTKETKQTEIQWK
jgi:hypothetical protein